MFYPGVPGRRTGGRADHASGRIRSCDPGRYRSNPSCGAAPRTAAAGSGPTAAAPTQERTGGTAEGNRHVFHRKSRQIFPQPPPQFIPDSLNIRGGAGDDTIEGGKGGDQLVGGDGDDTLKGDGGYDRLLGGKGGGNDVLEGGDGDDTLHGGKGRDTLYGDGGADTFIFRSGDGRDTIMDFEDGKNLIRIHSVEAADFGNLMITDGDGGVHIVYGDGDRIILRGMESADVTEEDFRFDLAINVATDGTQQPDVGGVTVDFGDLAG